MKQRLRKAMGGMLVSLLAVQTAMLGIIVSPSRAVAMDGISVSLSGSDADGIVKAGDKVRLEASIESANEIDEAEAPMISICDADSSKPMVKIDNKHWSYLWEVPAVNAACAVSVVATDVMGGKNVTTLGDTSFLIDNVAPILAQDALVSPKSGDIWKAGEEKVIVWDNSKIQDNENGSGVAGLDLYYVYGGGKSVSYPLAKGVANTGSFKFVVPAHNDLGIDTKARVVMEASDKAGNISGTGTSSLFTVINTAPQFKVSDGRLVEYVKAGDLVNLEATLEDGSVLKDGIVPKITLGASVQAKPMTKSGNGWVFPWLVSGSDSGRIKVLISAEDINGNSNVILNGRGEYLANTENPVFVGLYDGSFVNSRSLSKVEWLASDIDGATYNYYANGVQYGSHLEEPVKLTPNTLDGFYIIKVETVLTVEGEDVVIGVSSIGITVDGIAPLAVSGLKAKNDDTALNGGKVLVKWDLSSESDLAGYELRWFEKEGLEIGNLRTSSNNAEVEGLSNGSVYLFAVSAYDKAGNVGPEASVSAGPEDKCGPVIGQGNVLVTAKDGSVEIRLVGLAEGTVAKLYREGYAGNGDQFVANLNQDTVFVDANLINGTVYKYWIKALDTNGNVSESYYFTAQPKSVETVAVVTPARKIASADKTPQPVVSGGKEVKGADDVKEIAGNKDESKTSSESEKASKGWLWVIAIIALVAYLSSAMRRQKALAALKRVAGLVHRWRPQPIKVKAGTKPAVKKNNKKKKK